MLYWWHYSAKNLYQKAKGYAWTIETNMMLSKKYFFDSSYSLYWIVFCISKSKCRDVVRVFESESHLIHHDLHSTWNLLDLQVTAVKTLHTCTVLPSSLHPFGIGHILQSETQTMQYNAIPLLYAHLRMSSDNNNGNIFFG